MQAAVHIRYGSPEVVRIVEVDKPMIGPDEVLVEVHATTVNRTDSACRAAKPFFMRLFLGLVRPRATVLGFHDLRHFAATMAAISGATTKELMQFAGHSDIHAAMRYQEAVTDRKRDLAHRMTALANAVAPDAEATT